MMTFRHMPFQQPGARADVRMVTVVTAAWDLSRGGMATSALVLAVLGIALLSVGRSRLRGTTLVAPWAWGVASLAAIAGGEIGIACWDMGEAASLLRFMAAVTTFCPTMAVLGARRPQDGAWQWVVASLWLIVAWPALETMLYGGGHLLLLHPARQWFQLLLLLVGAGNALPTRHAATAACCVAGQLCLLANQLPIVGDRAAALLPGGGEPTLLALSLFALGALLWALNWPRPRGEADRWDRVWLQFRDGFGAVWALRVAERFNAAAAACGWNLRLRWSGFVPRDAAVSVTRLEDTPAAHQAFLQLLRRFVSPEWIEARRTDR